MKQSFIILLVILSSFKTEAKKLIYPIEAVAGMADLIVVGEIDAVQGHAYTFKISEILKGQSSKIISVNTFKEWTCDVRFAKPQKGQKLCLLLKKEVTGWEIINGSTGELFISGNSITLGAYEVYEPNHIPFSPYTLPVSEFKSGIKAFCKYYQYIHPDAARNTAGRFKQMASHEQIAAFKTSSKFTAWLYKKISQYPA